MGRGAHAPRWLQPCRVEGGNPRRQACLQAVCTAVHGAANVRWFGGVQLGLGVGGCRCGQELVKELCLLGKRDQRNL